MIIVASKLGEFVQPIVIIDYTRSDDNFTDEEIKTYSKQISSDFTKKATELFLQVLNPIVYSLNYEYTYTHSALSFGDAKRTSFTASILNAPNELVGLLRIREVVSSENLKLLGNSLSRVADSELTFPTGGLVTKDSDGNIIIRLFTIYSTPYEPDRFRIENKLILRGGSYEDVVLRLRLAANFKKGKSLSTQLTKLFSGLFYTLNFKYPDGKKTSVSKYYQPAPLNIILADICKDNKIGFKSQGATYTFYDLDPKNPPKALYKNRLSFFNSVPKTKMISNLTFSNYAIATIESELFNVNLFESIIVYDDSAGGKAQDLDLSTTLFYNLNKISELSEKFNAYQFYIIAYTIHDSRDATFLSITGSNNWLLNSVKIDALFENAIYRELLKK